jgi:multidrug resistance protein, MATE family
MVPLGAQVAATVLVGQAMGEGDHRKANQYFKLVALYNLILNGLIGLWMHVDREGLAHLFTSAETGEATKQMIMEGYSVDALVLILHGLAMVQAGAVRGLGMLELATWMVLFAFYFIALPAAYLLTFPLNMGMPGLWWGVVAGSLAEIVLYVLILRFFCNWKSLAIKISQELKAGHLMSPNMSMNRSLTRAISGGGGAGHTSSSSAIREPLIGGDLEKRKHAIN